MTVTGLLVLPSSASAEMTLDSVTIDRSKVVDPGNWTIPEDGGSASRVDQFRTITYSFPVPPSIPDAGADVTITVTAEARPRDEFTSTTAFGSLELAHHLGGNAVRATANSSSNPTASESKTIRVSSFSGPTPGKQLVKVTLYEGPIYTYTFNYDPDGGGGGDGDPCARAAAGLRAGAAQSCEIAPTVTLSDVKGKVEVQPGQGAWEPGTNGMKLKQGDKVHTGFKAGVTLTFPDGSTVRVLPMSFVHLENFSRDSDKKLRVRLLLRSGEVKANVQRLGGSYADFNVKTPTTTASVRGTKFSVLYDGRATTVAVTESSVLVMAENGEKVVVPAGMQTRSTGKGVAKPVKVGRGEKRGGLTAAKALGRLTAKLAKKLAACKFDAVSVRLAPAKGGWMGTFLIVPAGSGIDDKPTGKAKFRLKRKKVRAANGLAKKIARSCR